MQDRTHLASAQILLKSALELTIDAISVLKDGSDQDELPALEHIVEKIEGRIEAMRQRLLEDEHGISPHLQAKFDSGGLGPDGETDTGDETPESSADDEGEEKD